MSNYVTGMQFDLIMDRPYEEGKHYVVPGGYSVNGKPFDFESSPISSYPEENVIHCECYDICDVEEPGKLPTKEDVLTGNWDGFFIYTGEAGEPVIYQKEIQNLEISFEDGSSYVVPQEDLDKISKIFAENVRDEKQIREKDFPEEER
jgi:hypothetical protein